MLLSSFFQKIVIFTSKSLKRELSNIPDMETAPSSGGGAEAGTAIDSSLSAAGGLVDRHILVNDDYLDLAGLLGVASHLAPAVSGLQVVYKLSRITSRERLVLFLSPVFFHSLTLSLSLSPSCSLPLALMSGSRLPFLGRGGGGNECGETRSSTSRARRPVFHHAMQLRHGPLYAGITGLAHDRLGYLRLELRRRKRRRLLRSGLFALYVSKHVRTSKLPMRV